MSSFFKIKVLAVVVALSASVFFLQSFFLPLSLLNSEWRLTEMDGTSIGERAMLKFGYLTNSVTGNDGCNGFDASLLRAGSGAGLLSGLRKFILDDVGMTVMACFPNPYPAHLYYAILVENDQPLRLQVGRQGEGEPAERSAGRPEKPPKYLLMTRIARGALGSR